MEINNEKGYALWAKSYDHEKNPLIAVEEPHVDQLLQNISYSHVLDAGTGTGRNALRLAQSGIQITVIDNSPEMLNIARKNAYGASVDIEFHQGSLEEPLQFNAGEFDLVVCSLALSHIPNLAKIVKEFYRVCSKDGHVVITDFHPDSLAQGFRTEFTSKGITYLLPNFRYTREDYLEAVHDAGFTILRARDIPGNEIPEGYVSEENVNKYDDIGLCLIILGQKQ